MDENDVLELINSQKQILNLMDDEFYELQAANWRRLYNACIKQGFTEDQAIALVSASLRTMK